jgi:ABC-type sugar transport system permease subunit
MTFLGFYPVPEGLWYSLLHYRVTQLEQTHFLGLGNYVQAMGDPVFWTSMYNTAYFTVVAVVCSMFAGLGFALILNERFRTRGIVRTLVLVPWLMPPVVNGMIWKWIFNDGYGAFNAILYGLHLIPEYVPWLQLPYFAVTAGAFVFVWRTAPFVCVILLAGLQSISEDVYESATIDGASATQRFLHMTLPLLRAAIALVLVQILIAAVNTYDILYVLLGFAEPNLPLYTYETTFAFGDFGYGAALSWILTLSTLAIGYFYIRLLYREAYGR